MKSEKIKLLIKALKENNDINIIFGENIAYSSFFRDLEQKGLLIQPIFTKKIDCYTNSLVQIQIIDGKDSSTRMQIKEDMEVVEKFLVSKLKDFSGFETLIVRASGDEVILKNNKDRIVFTKRFDFYY
ncbi:hypothetical protein BKN14_00415 [Candidatus Gracilibacteria bacterium HOT-871]|nr:hypothetical protein BKN14_00415 [Candidatus Gracilibacteria bacterium HOT-871]